MSTPLETRSLPGAPWESAPAWLRGTDERWQAWLTSHIDLESSPWRELRWLTESREGIGLWILLFALLLGIELRSGEGRRRLGGLRLHLLALGPLLLASDAISVVLKEFFGRLKPHVNFYNPNVLPALSLPSSHAFNLAFLGTAVLLGLRRDDRRHYRNFLICLGALVLLVSLSRVFFGQHYPLDVLAGWIFGSATGALLVAGINGLRRLAESRSRVPKNASS